MKGRSLIMKKLTENEKDLLTVVDFWNHEHEGLYMVFLHDLKLIIIYDTSKDNGGRLWPSESATFKIGTAQGIASLWNAISRAGGEFSDPRPMEFMDVLSRYLLGL